MNTNEIEIERGLEVSEESRGVAKRVEIEGFRMMEDGEKLRVNGDSPVRVDSDGHVYYAVPGSEYMFHIGYIQASSWFSGRRCDFSLLEEISVVVGRYGLFSSLRDEPMDELDLMEAGERDRVLRELAGMLNPRIIRELRVPEEEYTVIDLEANRMSVDALGNVLIDISGSSVRIGQMVDAKWFGRSTVPDVNAVGSIYLINGDRGHYGVRRLIDPWDELLRMDRELANEVLYHACAVVHDRSVMESSRRAREVLSKNPDSWKHDPSKAYRLGRRDFHAGDAGPYVSGCKPVRYSRKAGRKYAAAVETHGSASVHGSASEINGNVYVPEKLEEKPEVNGNVQAKQ
jgi:hypothetical protein